MDDQNIDNKQNDTDKFLSRGCGCTPDPVGNNEGIYKKYCCKLDDHDWLEDIQLPANQAVFDIVEVRFKNSRKEFFRFQAGMEIQVGDIVAVEASPGHDIGIVSMMGETVKLQMKRRGADPKRIELKKLYRRVRTSDIEKWILAVEREQDTMIRSRRIAADLKLAMKINDIEYQGDNTKAVFYYTAEDRVDFRDLIKVLAEQFKIRIEMRQIGVRQEAARVGGIGSCGRELCCSTWMCNFKSVTTNAARVQQLSLNPQKLAGQCSKLKCCLNFEYDNYTDAIKKFPDGEVVLRTKKGDATLLKTDVFKELLYYSYMNEPSNIMAIPLKMVLKVIDMNNHKKKPEKLEDYAFIKEVKRDFENVVGQDDLTRFDK